MSTKLEAWREALESKEFKISRSKTECMEFRFKNSRKEDNITINIKNEEYPEQVVVRRSDGVQTTTKRKQRRPRKPWLETIRMTSRYVIKDELLFI